jgi:hypothetical protein
MAKMVENWRIFIQATANSQEEQKQIKAIRNCMKGHLLEPNFKMKLVGYCEEWGDVIETSSIIHMTVEKGVAHFTTYSGSHYVAKMNDYIGIFCHTVNGDIRVD